MNKFVTCLITPEKIRIYQEKQKVSFSPMTTTVIKDGTIIIQGNTAIIKGKQLIYHIHLSRTSLNKLGYEPVEEDIKYTWLLKRPYVVGWVLEKERRDFNRTFINYPIVIS